MRVADDADKHSTDIIAPLATQDDPTSADEHGAVQVVVAALEEHRAAEAPRSRGQRRHAVDGCLDGGGVVPLHRPYHRFHRHVGDGDPTAAVPGVLVIGDDVALFVGNVHQTAIHTRIDHRGVGRGGCRHCPSDIHEHQRHGGTEQSK